jgi:hypothetical protein
MIVCGVAAAHADNTTKKNKDFARIKCPLGLSLSKSIALPYISFYSLNSQVLPSPIAAHDHKLLIRLQINYLLTIIRTKLGLIATFLD